MSEAYFPAHHKPICKVKKESSMPTLLYRLKKGGAPASILQSLKQLRKVTPDDVRQLNFPK